MLTNIDIRKLKTIFITKEDFKKFATKDELKRFASKDDLKRMEKRIIIKFNEVLDFFDEKVVNHERRIRNLETQNAIAL